MDDRAALLALPKEQLVDIILAQRETIARLEALVVQLSARVAELEAKIDELTRPPTTPDDPSLPPSAAFKPNRAERRARKHGPKRGHQGHSRLRQPPDLVVQCHVAACRGCGHALDATGQRRVRRSQVIDVVPARAVVVESWAYQARCTECGLVTVAEHPAGLESTRTFGPELETAIAYLHERHHVSFERLVELCKDLFGVQLSEGAVAKVLQRLGERGETRYEEIKELVRASPVIGSDETGARVGGRNRWHWTFQSKTASYHVIARTRSGSVIDDFLDGAVPDVYRLHWSLAARQSDAYAPQLRAPAKTGQLCLAHQLRELTRAAELEPDAAWWATELRHVFGRGMRLHAERAQISAESFQRRKVRIINAAECLIKGPPLGKGMARRLQQRYQRLWSELFVFLERDGVEPTNNASERDLRNSVIHRKVTGGYRSEWGSQTSAILTSVLQTARKQGQNLYAAIRMLSGPSPLAAAYGT